MAVKSDSGVSDWSSRCFFVGCVGSGDCVPTTWFSPTERGKGVGLVDGSAKRLASAAEESSSVFLLGSGPVGVAGVFWFFVGAWSFEGAGDGNRERLLGALAGDRERSGLPEAALAAWPWAWATLTPALADGEDSLGTTLAGWPGTRATLTPILTNGDISPAAERPRLDGVAAAAEGADLRRAAKGVAPRPRFVPLPRPPDPPRPLEFPQVDARERRGPEEAGWERGTGLAERFESFRACARLNRRVRLVPNDV